MNVDKIIDYSIVAFVTYGKCDHVLLIRESSGELRLPSGPNIEDEIEEAVVVSRVLKQQAGIDNTTLEQVQVIGVKHRSIKRKVRGKKELYEYPVLLIQVIISIEEYLDHDHSSLLSGAELIFLPLYKIESTEGILGYHRYLLSEYVWLLSQNVSVGATL